jgi:hypothetical protein
MTKRLNFLNPRPGTIDYFNYKHIQQSLFKLNKYDKNHILTNDDYKNIYAHPKMEFKNNSRWYTFFTNKESGLSFIKSSPTDHPTMCLAILKDELNI